MISHIHAHPDADQSLDTLVDVAALSRLHFARVFQAVTGRTATETVRRVRMDHAAVALCYSDRPIAEIATAVGNADVTSFTRAFAKTLGLPSGAYRDAGLYRPELATLKTGEREMTHPVTIREMPERRLVALEHFGP